MNIKEQLAHETCRILKKSNKNPVVIDPVTISIIISIFDSAIQLYKTCSKTPEQAVQTAYNPEVQDIKKLKAVVRKQVGFVEYWRHGNQYVDALLQLGKQVTHEDMKELYNEDTAKKEMVFRV